MTLTAGGIHHADNMQVFRNRERYSAVNKWGLCTFVVLLDQHFPEDLTHVATIDLDNIKEVFFIRVICCSLAENDSNLYKIT